MDNDFLLSDYELKRYNRHISLSEIGIHGQQKLKKSKVLVIGAGGLGCPLLIYLTRAGIGTIGIVDHDTVDESNLQRQILYTDSNIGKLKVEAARKYLSQLNPDIKINIYSVKLSKENAQKIFNDYDIIVDGTDNFQAKYLINDACVFLKKPYVYASVLRFEGQLSVFNYSNSDGITGPNYRCLYPDPPLSEEAPDCNETGILGTAAGIMGCMQANEVIKIITSIGNILSDALLLINLLTLETKRLKIKKDENNPLNGKKPLFKRIEDIDYNQFCNFEATKSINSSMKEITVKQLKQKIDNKEDFQLIDVREEYEYEIANIGGQLMPLGQILNEVNNISKSKPVIIHCRSGARSASAIHELENKFGFTNLYNLQGGILAYAKEIDPSIPAY